MDQTQPTAPGRTAPLVPGVIAAGLVIIGHSAAQVLGEQASIAFVVLLALTVLADWLALRVPSMPISFSISDTFSIAVG